MRNVAIIGVSGFGATHYNDLMAQADAGRMRPVAATVINQDEEEEKCTRLRELGCALFEDYVEMLRWFAGKLDFCFVPTGIPLHAPMTIAALEAGANVFVEKPVAATVQEVAAMRAAETATGKFAAVGYQHVYGCDVHDLKRRLCAGEFGEVKSLRCMALWPRDGAYYSRNGWAGRLHVRERWVLDSPFNNALAHMLNLMCFLGGATFAESATPVSILAELYRANDIESTDTFCMRAATTEGPSVYFAATHVSAQQHGPVVVVTCDRATIEWSFNGLSIRYADGGEESVAVPSDPDRRASIMACLLARADDPDGFVCSLDMAGKQTLCANGAHESSAIHQIPVDLVSEVPTKLSTRKVVAGLDEAMREAFTDGRLFSEIGVPWAKPGTEFDLAGYTHFNGGRTGVKA